MSLQIIRLHKIQKKTPITPLSTDNPGFHYTTTVSPTPDINTVSVMVDKLVTTNICGASNYEWYIDDDSNTSYLIASGNNPTFHSDEMPSRLVILPYKIRLKFTQNGTTYQICSPWYTGSASNWAYTIC